MSEQRSRSSGVQGLRAMFEQSNETTSPPSRGRSPAGSVASDGSRPYSKVRTSFISVDQGQLESTSRKMSHGNGAVGGDGADEATVAAEGSNAEVLKVNGHAAEEIPSEDIASRVDTVDATDIPNGSGREDPKDVKAANPDKPVTGAQEDPAEMLPADPKEEAAVTGGTALKGDPDLGSVLKGSPFAASKTEQSVKAPEAGSKPRNTTNGQVKEVKSPSSKRITQTKGLTRPTATATASITKGAPGKASLEGKAPVTRAVKPDTAPAQAPRFDAQKADSMKTRHSSIRSSAGSKSGPPRPKSPTRPLRLPASATAPTASSAAKLGGGAPPSRSPSRASIASSHKPSTVNKSRPTPLTSTTAQSRQKPVRSSLPPLSGAVSKPKPRTSTASAKGTDDDFLARMMRPTTSSAKKTQDKVEAKSPPSRKTVHPNKTPPRKTVHPNRLSGASQTSKKDQVKEPTKANGEATATGKLQQDETSSSTQEATAESPAEEKTQASADTDNKTSAPVEPVQ